MKILVSDKMENEGLDLLKAEKSIEFDYKPEISAQDLLNSVGEYEGLIVRSRTKVTKDVIAKADKMKIIGRAGAGVDNIDVKSAKERNIVVVNTPGGNTISVAEHCFAMMLALTKNLIQADQSMKNKKWEKNAFMGVELYEQTLGIIGLGRIGREVAKRARAFEMTVLAYDPFVKTTPPGIEAEMVNLDVIFRESDFITIHTPLDDTTKNLISDKEFDMMKKNVRIINCARGGIINEQALYNALKNGKIAGAALDVFEKEPIPTDSPLLELNNVIFTPHIAAATKQAQTRVAKEIVETVIDYLKNGNIRNAV